MFKKSIGVYSEKYLNEKNISLIFPIDFSFKEGLLRVAGSNEFQIFLNGKLIGYGPARGAHNVHRVDEYKISSNCEDNRIIILVSGYNVLSFDRIKETPFIRYELVKNNEVVKFSTISSDCYLNEARYQKVVRFSYQRNLSESYNIKYDPNIFNYGYQIKFEKQILCFVDYGVIKERNINYPLLNYIDYKSSQYEDFLIDEAIKPYEDRYMFFENLILFPKVNWDVDINKIASQITIKNIRGKNNNLHANQSMTFGYKESLTGFINCKITVSRKSLILIYFDEVNTSNDVEIIDFKFYRNNTHNVISYELEPGDYNLLSFSPYTAKYIRIALIFGEIIVNSLGIIVLENPDSYKLKFSFSDRKYNNIMNAARNTFAANAVDILTDCPSRERAGWLCDSYFSSRAEALFTGRNLIEKNFLENYADYREGNIDIPKKMIPMSYPSDAPAKEYIPNWSMFYVLQLRNYLKRTNDMEMIRKSRTNVMNLVDFFSNEENDECLLEDLKGWVFVEWSHENDASNVCGVNVPSNILYASFLEAVDDIYICPDLREKSKKIRKWLIKNAFNGTYFVDNLIRKNGKLVQTSNIGETTQYYAFYFDLINEKEYSELFNLLVKDFGPKRDVKKTHPECYKSNMIVGNYLRLELLNRNCLYDLTLKETIDYFYEMSFKTGTLWENDSLYASLNHGFASFAANIIVEAISGIQKIDRLIKRVYVKKIKPLFNFELNIPVEDGYINVKTENDEIVITCDNDFIIEYV